MPPRPDAHWPLRAALIGLGLIGGIALARLGLEAGPRNWLGWALAAVGMAYGLGSALWFAFRGEYAEAVRAEAGDRSFWGIVPGFIAAFFWPPLEFLYLPALLPRLEVMPTVGAVVIALGFALRAWTRWALGRMYSAQVQVQAGHRLVRNGPYRFARHPGYAGFVLMALGLALGFSSLGGLLAILVLLLPGLAYRMRVEEQMLTEQFGDEYRVYAQATARLIPGLW